MYKCIKNIIKVKNKFTIFAIVVYQIVYQILI